MIAVTPAAAAVSTPSENGKKPSEAITEPSISDGVETAAAAGVTAIISPAGSLQDAAVIKKANELGVALYHAPERIFSHH
jgi:AICAR transformylase/IMP cyclohydrolase PurH